MKTTIQTVDQYIESVPPDVRPVLQKIRQTIHEAVPEAEESISYEMPTFKLNGKRLIYFAAFKKHIGVYPIPAGDDSFAREISPYVKGRGTLQFPLGRSFPYDLLRRIVGFAVKANLASRGQKGSLYRRSRAERRADDVKPA